MGRLRSAFRVAPVCLLIAVAVAAADVDGWTDFGSSSLGFRVEIPAPPSYAHTSELTIAGRVHHHHHQVDVPGLRFDIERHDLPAIATLLFSPDALLDRAARDLMDDLGATLHRSRVITLQGQPGRRLDFELGTPAHPEESRLFLVGRRLFIVTAGPYAPELRETAVDRFFESFRFCGEEIGEPCQAPGRDGARDARRSDHSSESPRSQ